MSIWHHKHLLNSSISLQIFYRHSWPSDCHLFPAWMVQSSPKQVSSFLISLSPLSSTKIVRVTFLKHNLGISLFALHYLMASHCSCEEQVPNMAYHILYSLFHLSLHAQLASLFPVLNELQCLWPLFSPLLVHCSSLPQGLCKSHILCQESSYSSPLFFTCFPFTHPSDVSSKIAFLMKLSSPD